jgi:hypothetical protein
MDLGRCVEVEVDVEYRGTWGQTVWVVGCSVFLVHRLIILI